MTGACADETGTRIRRTVLWLCGGGAQTRGRRGALLTLLEHFHLAGSSATYLLTQAEGVRILLSLMPPAAIAVCIGCVCHRRAERERRRRCEWVLEQRRMWEEDADVGRRTGAKSGGGMGAGDFMRMVAWKADAALPGGGKRQNRRVRRWTLEAGMCEGGVRSGPSNSAAVRML